MTTITDLAWPAARVGEALLAFLPAQVTPSALPQWTPASVAQDAAALDRWIATTASQLGLEAVAFNALHPELSSALVAADAAVLRLPDSSEPRFLVLVGSKGKRLRLLGPDHAVRTVAVEAVRASLCQAAEARLGPEIDGLLQQAQWLRHGDQARASLMAERLRHVRVEAGWLVRMPATSPLRGQIERSGLSGVIVRFLAAHVASHVAWIMAWLTVGEDALQGRLDTGWLIAGALMLAMFMVLRVTADRLQSVLSLRLGVLLRQRLFEGALALDARAARGEGVGQFLGRLFEAQAVEALSVSGGLSAATAVLELVAALVILAWGAGAWALAGLLVAAMALCFAIAGQHLRARRRWTGRRREITHDLIERMVGHRTRLAQEDRRRWHDREDQTLSGYLAESRRFDAGTVWLTSVMPRGWLVAAALGLGWAFSAGASMESLAVCLAAILLAFQSFRRLVLGLPAIAAAVVAWEQAAPLLRAAAATAPAGAVGVAAAPSSSATSTPSEPQLEAQGLAFRSQAHGRSVLRDVSLNIRVGDRVLLEGPSGGGKSTLAALLAGLRRPDQGVLLLDGLDLATLGEGAWRCRVALAAQFHENHVVSETFAFNLLMGRAWPPAADDLQKAEAICREIGLGRLLDRMPAGLHQAVGESGWQLSHGERSRLFLARALLQDADIVILDESFAALDPESLSVTLACVLQRAPALVVVAHP